MPYHMNGMASRQLNIKEAPYSKQWEVQPLSAPLAWTTDHYKEAHMPAVGKLQRVVMLQTPMVEVPLVSMAATWEHESKKQTPLMTPTHDIKIHLEAQLKKENLPVKDPWHVAVA